MGPSTANPTPPDRLVDFLQALAQALHVSGAPAQDLERELAVIGARMGVRVQCFALPTMLSLTVEAEGRPQAVRLIRLPPYDYNMVRLIKLEAMLRELHGPADLARGEAQLQQIVAAPPIWRGWRFVACGFLLSASVALLLRGSWAEMLSGGIVGALFVMAYQRLGGKPSLGPVLPVLLCGLAALCSYALAALLPQQSPFITVLAGIVLMLPGFTMTIAMSELATQNLVAGTGRLAGAFMLMLMMGAGVAIGSTLAAEFMPVAPTGTAAPLPDWAMWPNIAVLGVGLLAVLQAPLRSVHVVILACLLAWGISFYVSHELGPVAGAFAGAFGVAMAGHLYQRFSGKPGILVQVPGLITLVPGSVGFRGLHALMEQDTVTGLGILATTVVTGAALVVGTLLANGIGPAVVGRRGEARVP
jgi:uncharacterized membrane protein YjjP (DUF1212 family)